MIYAFDNFELDASKVELREGGVSVAIEPQVFALLLLLVENSDRMVSKDEIIEKVWDGRIVSESALTSRIKSARKALGDDGKTQGFIKTIHGQGFRFVAEATPKHGSAPASVLSLPDAPQLSRIELPKAPVSQKPSVAVLPFRLVGIAGAYAAIADALPHELITVLSRLRWLFVIARGSSFRFRSSEPDMKEIGQVLGVRYCLSGVIEITGDKIRVTVELCDTRDQGVLWGENFSGSIDDIHNIREQIISSVVSGMEIQIPMNEALAARLKPSEQLDAWSAYHLGLQHLHRFNSKDNAIATKMFENAIALDPGFARAHAGLSSTHFQNAFLKYNNDLSTDRKLARRHAERSVELDPLDPFANFSMGRTHWIESNTSGSIGWLERATALSPNYAQGVYAHAWADLISGHGVKGAENIDLAIKLSPLDPFRYAMLGVRAFTHLIREEDSEAAFWADEAARSPGAHVLIAAIAVAAHGLNSDRQKAHYWAENVRHRKSDLTQADFFQAFPFDDAPTRQRLSKALGAYGF